MLEALADGVWVIEVPQTFYGLHLGTRMTVVRLQDGNLLLHSPIRIDDALKAELDRLGRVTHIVSPNIYHHLYAGDAKKLWPEALLHGSKQLQRKRRDLVFDEVFHDSQPHPDWKGLHLVTIGGCMLGETVMVHQDSGTLISCDLIENFTTSPHWPTRCYLKLSGVHGKPGWSRLFRWIYTDRKRARSDLERLLAYDFDRLILSHGNLVERDAQGVLRQGMGWLL